MARKKQSENSAFEQKGEHFEFGGEMPEQAELPAAEVLGIEEYEKRNLAERDLENCTINTKVGAVVFDPFAVVENDKIIEDQMAAIEDMLTKGEITPKDARKAMRNVYRVQHSTGRDILGDRRRTTESRIELFVAWALANPTKCEEMYGRRFKTYDEAETFAVMELAKQRKLAGNWGTVAVKRNILKR